MLKYNFLLLDGIQFVSYRNNYANYYYAISKIYLFAVSFDETDIDLTLCDLSNSNRSFKTKILKLENYF